MFIFRLCKVFEAVTVCNQQFKEVFLVLKKLFIGIFTEDFNTHLKVLDLYIRTARLIEVHCHRKESSDIVEMSPGCCITTQPAFASGRCTISTFDGSKSNRRSRKSALSTNDCEFASKSRSQLHNTFATIPKTNSLNCCRNYYSKGSVLSSSIRRFQSSPSSHVKKSIESPLLKRKDVALYLILFLLHATTVQAISSASVPLTRTDGEYMLTFVFGVFLLH